MEALREKLARLAILFVLWVTRTTLTHDGGYEMSNSEWGVICDYVIVYAEDDEDDELDDL